MDKIYKCCGNCLHGIRIAGEHISFDIKEFNKTKCVCTLYFHRAKDKFKPRNCKAFEVDFRKKQTATLITREQAKQLMQ